MRRLVDVLYPELQAFSEADRNDVLQQARRAPLEFIELTGIALALVVVTALTRYSVDALEITDRVALAAVNFAVALPPLLAIVGPILVHRTRRGLRAEMQLRGLSTARKSTRPHV